MYYLVLIVYRQIDDLSLNDDPIGIPKIISVIIKLFYNRSTIRSFSHSQSCNENSVSLPCVTSLLLLDSNQTILYSEHISRSCKTISQRS